MKIRQIQIRNLRAIDELDLDLCQAERDPLDLAVLAGPNGCGKTSVLEACLWALKQDALVPRPLPEQPYLIELTAEHAGATYRFSRTPEGHTVARGDEPPAELPKKGLPAWLKARVLYFSSWRAPRLIGSVGLSTGQAKSLRRSPNNALANLKQELVDLQGAGSFGEPDESGGRGGDEAEAVYRRIADLWRELYPAKEGRFRGYKVKRPGSSQAETVKSDTRNAIGFDIFLRDKDRPGGVRVDDLSSGEIEALSMIGSFVMESEGFDLVCVDEPELHLHPAWHRAIMRVLRRAAPGAQIICATHSEHILDAVYSHQRFTLLPQSDPRLRLAAHR